MKKLSKASAIKTSRKLALETSTLKQLSGDQLSTAQGGVFPTVICGITVICDSKRCATID